MHLLYPIGLIALAGLIVPLIIHLWKLKQGKTLRIGSIALLGTSSPFTSRSYQITDWLLLFLRMLLIALLAFLLAEPYMKKGKEEALQKGWLLLEKEQLPKLYKTERKRIDSLIQAGYELHDFGLKFQEISLKDTLNVNSGSTTAVSKMPKLSYHALLRTLNAQIKSNFPVYLYADRRLEELGGALPAIDFRLTWKAIKSTDTLGTWTSNFAHKTFEATSSSALTTFKRLDEAQEGTGIKVLIYGDDSNEDLKYLKAAIQAIAKESKRNIEVDVFNEKNNSDLRFDVGFWISTKGVSSGFLASLRDGARLFNYAGEKNIALNSWLVAEPEGKGNAELISLRKRTIAAVYPGAKIWTDGFGTPLLTRTKEKALDHYRFYSRLNPIWNELVWKEKFVELMMPILLGDDGTDTGFGFEMSPVDQRRSFLSLNPSSGGLLSSGSSEIVNKEVAIQSVGLAQEESLQKVFWIMAILVFTTERILSFRLKNREQHG
ncbi:BatA domain-containing protein [Pedobacter gandavensis]|uniref:BatA domain-containing protein n=1 Tax=Pedobacter gandavensis TaxID=2679963 RepID=UPI0029301AD8|nr:BatA domain-containing protein [Pedobacter gandavensis]